MEASAGGGGGGETKGTPAAMQGMASQLQAQAQQWSDTFAAKLGTCGNPTLDGAIGALGGQFASAAASLSGASSKTAAFTSSGAGNFSKAGGQ